MDHSDSCIAKWSWYTVITDHVSELIVSNESWIRWVVECSIRIHSSERTVWWSWNNLGYNDHISSIRIEVIWNDCSVKRHVNVSHVIIRISNRWVVLRIVSWDNLDVNRSGVAHAWCSIITCIVCEWILTSESWVRIVRVRSVWVERGNRSVRWISQLSKRQVVSIRIAVVRAHISVNWRINQRVVEIITRNRWTVSWA